MKVCYKEFTGELVRLERRNKKEPVKFVDGGIILDSVTYVYDLDIYDKQKGCKICITDVNLSDIKFIGGNTTF